MKCISKCHRHFITSLSLGVANRRSLSVCLQYSIVCGVCQQLSKNFFLKFLPSKGNTPQSALQKAVSIYITQFYLFPFIVTISVIKTRNSADKTQQLPNCSQLPFNSFVGFSFAIYRFLEVKLVLKGSRGIYNAKRKYQISVFPSFSSFYSSIWIFIPVFGKLKVKMGKIPLLIIYI